MAAMQDRSPEAHDMLEKSQQIEVTSLLNQGSAAHKCALEGRCMLPAAAGPALESISRCSCRGFARTDDVNPAAKLICAVMQPVLGSFVSS